VLTAAPQALAAVPDAQIPPSVAAEVKQLENQFELALSQDCPADKCFSRGCTYVSHATADKPKQGALPGLGDSRGPGATAAQEFLTAARCELATETTIPAKDRQALIQRLQQKLARGYTVVNVDAKQLPPLPESLKATPTPEATPSATPTSPSAANRAAELDKQAEKDWTKEGLFREFWLSVLPYFPWMIGALVLTLCTSMLIWAARRLGKQTVEEKLMEASLSATPPRPLDLPAPEKPETNQQLLDVEAEEKAFVETQRHHWRGRAVKEQDLMNTLLVNWLKTGDFPLLAKSVLEFDGIVKPHFPENGEFAGRKLEFSEFLKNAKREEMPRDAEFYRVLNQHALVASILAQRDVEVYSKIREEFGPMGIRQLMNAMPVRLGSILFTLLPRNEQRATAHTLTELERKEVVRELLRSNRASREELGTVLEAVKAVFDQQPVPSFAQKTTAADHGQEMDAAGALSVLLPSLSPQVRKELISASLQSHGGIVQGWMLRIFYPEMLLGLSTDLRTSIMLNVDLPSLVTWVNEQPLTFRQKLKQNLPQSLENAMATASVGPRGNPHLAAKTIAENLVAEYSTQKIQWVDLVTS
jgi:hypothetical protein